MDRAAALDRLPELYAQAIRLRDAGVTREEIAVRLGIALEAVAPCLSVAEAKLARIMALIESPADQGPP